MVVSSSAGASAPRGGEASVGELESYLDRHHGSCVSNTRPTARPLHAERSRPSLGENRASVGFRRDFVAASERAERHGVARSVSRRSTSVLGAGET